MTSRAQKRATYRTLRPKVREAVWKRDGGQCRACGRAVGLSWADMHEIVPRSLGGNPLDSRNVITLCGGPTGCHAAVGMRVGGRRLTITVLTPRGANGPVQITRTFGDGDAEMSISEPTQQLEEEPDAEKAEGT